MDNNSSCKVQEKKGLRIISCKKSLGNPVRGDKPAAKCQLLSIKYPASGAANITPSPLEKARPFTLLVAKVPRKRVIIGASSAAIKISGERDHRGMVSRLEK